MGEFTVFMQTTLLEKIYENWKFLVEKSFIDLDYVYGTLGNSDGEDPLDYQKEMNSCSKIFIVATNAITGEAKYFDKSNMKQECYDILKAFSAILIA